MAGKPTLKYRTTVSNGITVYQYRADVNPLKWNCRGQSYVESDEYQAGI